MVVFDLSDCCTPVFFTVYVGKDLGRNLFGCAVKNDLPLSQTYNAVRKRLGEAYIMDVDQRRCTPFMRQFHQKAHYLTGGFWIKARGRLINEQKIGLLHERTRYADPLTLTTGQRISTRVLIA